MYGCLFDTLLLELQVHASLRVLALARLLAFHMITSVLQEACMQVYRKYALPMARHTHASHCVAASDQLQALHGSEAVAQQRCRDSLANHLGHVPNLHQL